MNFHTFSVKTSSRCELIDISRKVRECLNKNSIKEGFCIVFCPHTTGAITINENADPAVQRDIIHKLDLVYPYSDNYTHMEGNSAAHIKSSLTGASETIIITNGELVLGTWQGIFFCEFDGPRNRKVHVQIIGA